MYILTRSGRRVDPWDVIPRDVCLEDITGSLCNICRYTGHSKEFYSVAQHSILVSRLLESACYSPDTVKAGLFHDATEAYLTDLNTPTKIHLPEYKDAERRAEAAIFYKLGLDISPEIQSSVKKADTAAFVMERQLLLPPDNWEAPRFELEHLGMYRASLDCQYVLSSFWAPDVACSVFKEEARIHGIT